MVVFLLFGITEVLFRSLLSVLTSGLFVVDGGWLSGVVGPRGPCGLLLGGQHA